MSAQKLRTCIVGAEGLTGFESVRILMREHRQCIQEILCLVSDSNHRNVPKLRELGAKIEQLDVQQQDKLQKNLQSRDVLVIVPDPELLEQNQASQIVQTVIKTASQSGVKRLILVSSTGAEESDASSLNQFQNFENQVEQSQFEQGWVILRTNMYQEHFLLYANQVQQNSIIELPIDENKKWAPLSVEDGARSISTLVGKSQQWSQYKNKTSTLTGPQSHSPKEIVELMSNSIGGRVQYRKVAMSDAEKYLNQIQGLSSFMRSCIIDYLLLINSGKLDMQTKDVQNITQKEPTKLDQFFKDNASRFRS